ncbi:MAG: magnesium-translocating P-type ATPase [Deltaproteobacteria bacterium]
MTNRRAAFWSISGTEWLEELQSRPGGLTSAEARERLTRYGPNRIRAKRRTDALSLFLTQFESPIILILLFAAGLSLFLSDAADAFIILTIVLVSGLLGFWQERGATNAVEKLLAIVRVQAAVLRDGQEQEISAEEVVPGDVVVLNAGDVIPGDCLLLEAKDLFVDEAALTGETYPVEKQPGLLPLETSLSERTNALFMGTHVVSGKATALIVFTAGDTEFGKVSASLRLRPPETEFERGVRRFGYLLMEVTLVLVIAIFAINVYFARPVLESFLFSLALAVGLTPQLLPAIITINLAHGAKQMALEKVIVKRLAAIENFGSMNVLCCDKTGTLTEGAVRVHAYEDLTGRENEKVLFYAYLNAFYETGFTNPIDAAIRSHRAWDLTGYHKLDEIPYDFLRKRLSVLVAKDGVNLLITKGAVPNVLEACTTAETGGEVVVNLNSEEETIQQRFEEFGSKGFRALGVAYRDLGAETRITKDHEAHMTFLGFLVFSDPEKPGIVETIAELRRLGISLKVISGDNHRVATYVSRQVGLTGAEILTGSELREIGNEALAVRAREIDVFAEVEPNQKERIILALKKSGNVVGFMGDGINDASALHAADVGISVDSAVDVAKEAADIVLLEKNLQVLVEGVQQGRTTFANTLKYVFMATSANFGNMFSMAGASLFLPFLPLLPKQILLTNLLTDLPEMAIATDCVDHELVQEPRRWDIRFIRKFMFIFGLISSVFDYLTFAVLLFLLHANVDHFRTGWFMESVVSASLIVLIIRTRKPFFRSKPGRSLWVATLSVVLGAIAFPYTKLAWVFGFAPMPLEFLFVLLGILFLYIVAAEAAKAMFYHRVQF